MQVDLRLWLLLVVQLWLLLLVVQDLVRLVDHFIRPSAESLSMMASDIVNKHASPSSCAIVILYFSRTANRISTSFTLVQLSGQTDKLRRRAISISFCVERFEAVHFHMNNRRWTRIMD